MIYELIFFSALAQSTEIFMNFVILKMINKIVPGVHSMYLLCSLVLHSSSVVAIERLFWRYKY